MRSVITYTASRFLLFAAAFGVLYVLGARGFLALALAFLLSGLASFVLLSKQRDAMSAGVAGGLRRMRGVGDRFEAGAAHEDGDTQAAERPASADAAAEASASGDPARTPAPGSAGS